MDPDDFNEGSFFTSGGDNDILYSITRNDGDEGGGSGGVGDEGSGSGVDLGGGGVGDEGSGSGVDLGGISWKEAPAVDVTAEYGPEASGYQVFKDPNSNKILVIAPDGTISTSEGNLTSQKQLLWDPNAYKNAPSGIGAVINDFAKNFFTTKDASGKVTPNLAAITGLSAFLASGTGKKLLGTGEAPKVGYQGSIPKYTAVRERVGGLDDTTRRPGSGGRRYFSDTTYADKDKPAELAAAKTAAQTQATGLATLNKENPFYEKRPESVMPKEKEEKEEKEKKGIATISRPASKVIEDMPVPKYDEKGNVIKSDYLDEPLARVTTGLGGAKASPGYFFGPADEALPDTVKTYRDYENWKSSQGVKTLPSTQNNAFSDFYNSPEYKSYKDSQMGGMTTMDMYDSPYFGSISGGSAGRAQDQAYTDYLTRTGQSSLIKAPQQTSVELPPAQTDGQGNVIAAYGGLMNLASGRYLRGATDGMADKLSANIEGKQPAKLSHGEFVVPADVVGHLGNGNSEAGAKRLYDMMDKIRQARTGTTKQGKQINPNKYLPA